MKISDNVGENSEAPTIPNQEAENSNVEFVDAHEDDIDSDQEFVDAHGQHEEE
jgi:hypothetical protein